MHGSIKDGSPSSSGNIPFMRMIMVTTVMPHSLGLSSIEWETNFMRAKLVVD
jgi:hypothetical protein